MVVQGITIKTTHWPCFLGLLSFSKKIITKYSIMKFLSYLPRVAFSTFSKNQRVFVKRTSLQNLYRQRETRHLSQKWLQLNHHTLIKFSTNNNSNNNNAGVSDTQQSKNPKIGSNHLEDGVTTNDDSNDTFDDTQRPRVEIKSANIDVNVNKPIYFREMPDNKHRVYSTEYEKPRAIWIER